MRHPPFIVYDFSHSTLEDLSLVTTALYPQSSNTNTPPKNSMKNSENKKRDATCQIEADQEDSVLDLDFTLITALQYHFSSKQ